MQLSQAIVDPIGAALARVCPPERLTLLSIERFLGPTPGITAGAIVGRIECRSPLPALAPIEQRLQSVFPFEVPSADTMASLPDDPSAVASMIARCGAGILASKLGLDLDHGTRPGSGAQADFWFDPFYEGIGLRLLACALVAVGALVSEKEDPAGCVAAHLADLSRRLLQRGPAANIAVLISAARRRGIPDVPLAGSHAAWQFGWGARSERFWMATSDGDGAAGFQLMKDKSLCKVMFRDLGFPTPPWRLVPAGSDPGPAAEAIGWPCVVKPVLGSHGIAVSTGIRDKPSLDRAVAEARRQADLVMIEAHLAGEDHRLMVIDGVLVSAVNRLVPAVVGDGRSNVRALIAAFNAPRLLHKRRRTATYLVPVQQDAVLAVTLQRQGLALESIPAAGRQVRLRSTANVSTGGTPVDVTARVHPRVRFMAVDMAASFGQRVTGIDYMTTDIARSPEETGGGFIEINGTPGINVLLAAGYDEDEIGGQLLGARPGRIPLALILVDEGRRAAAEKAIAKHMDADMADGTAAASSAWARIGPLHLSDGFREPLAAIHAALRNATVERLTILWTKEELIRFGLPLDSFDTIAVLGTMPAAPWRDLLRTRSKRLHPVRTLAEAVAICFETAGDDEAP